MNRFKILKCVELKEDGYDGPSVVLACSSDPEFMLFFPVAEDSSKLINYVLERNNKYDVNTNILGIYKTMVDSWKSTDKYLCGVIMDSVYDQELKDEVLSVKIALSDMEGDLDSLVNVNFLHSVILAAMENVDIVICDSLLNKMIPEDEEDDENEEDTKNKQPKQQHFPEDKKIVDIAKKIMSGKVKDK